jgi:hypothetical protein
MHRCDTTHPATARSAHAATRRVCAHTRRDATGLTHGCSTARRPRSDASHPRNDATHRRSRATRQRHDATVTRPHILAMRRAHATTRPDDPPPWQSRSDATRCDHAATRHAHAPTRRAHTATRRTHAATRRANVTMRRANVTMRRANAPARRANVTMRRANAPARRADVTTRRARAHAPTRAHTPTRRAHQRHAATTGSYSDSDTTNPRTDAIRRDAPTNNAMSQRTDATRLAHARSRVTRPGSDTSHTTPLRSDATRPLTGDAPSDATGTPQRDDATAHRRAHAPPQCDEPIRNLNAPLSADATRRALAHCTRNLNDATRPHIDASSDAIFPRRDATPLTTHRRDAPMRCDTGVTVTPTHWQRLGGHGETRPRTDSDVTLRLLVLYYYYTTKHRRDTTRTRPYTGTDSECPHTDPNATRLGQQCDTLAAQRRNADSNDSDATSMITMTRIVTQRRRDADAALCRAMAACSASRRGT